MTLEECTGWESDGGLRSEVLNLLEGYPYLQYRDLGMGSTHELAAIALEDMVRLEGVLVLARDGDTAVGMALCHSLPWDSGLFGLRMARIEPIIARDQDTAVSLIRGVLHNCRVRGIRHVSVRTGISEYPVIHALEQQGFYLVDTLSVLWAASGPSCEHMQVDHIRDYEPSLLPYIREIARRSFTISRFTVDPHLDPKLSREVYVKWVTDGVAGRADSTKIAVDDGIVSGFALCRRVTFGISGREVPVGLLDLVAVAPEFQGRGVGRRLVRAACHWLRANSEYYFVGTRGDNYPAIAVYLGEGFRFYRGKVGFHAWLG